MTIAFDRATGKVLGQYCGERVENADRVMVPTYENRIGDFVLLLTRDGYKTVPRTTVRLEDVR